MNDLDQNNQKTDTTPYFQKFYENIKLTPKQREDAKIKYDGVCGKLHSIFYPNTTYDGHTRFLIGSYGKGTHLRPARDIDVIFKMPLEKFKQYDDYVSNGQSQLLQDIKNNLEEKYPNTEIKAFGKVVVLKFTDSQHNVEVMPAFERDDGTFLIPNSEDGGKWEIYDPRGEIEAIKRSEENTGKTKMLVRMMKKWTEHCSCKVKSHIIEKEVIEFCNSCSFNNTHWSIIVRDFLRYFYFKSVGDDNLQSHLNTALNRAKKACEFEEKGQLEQAIDEWRKIFGDDFSKQEIKDNQPYIEIEEPVRPHGYPSK